MVEEIETYKKNYQLVLNELLARGYHGHLIFCMPNGNIVDYYSYLMGFRLSTSLLESDGMRHRYIVFKTYENYLNRVLCEWKMTQSDMYDLHQRYLKMKLNKLFKEVTITKTAIRFKKLDCLKKNKLVTKRAYRNVKNRRRICNWKFDDRYYDKAKILHNLKYF